VSADRWHRVPPEPEFPDHWTSDSSTVKRISEEHKRFIEEVSNFARLAVIDPAILSKGAH
jgi:hypothetical protein